MQCGFDVGVKCNRAKAPEICNVHKKPQQSCSVLAKQVFMRGLGLCRILFSSVVCVSPQQTKE